MCCQLRNQQAILDDKFRLLGFGLFRSQLAAENLDIRRGIRAEGDSDLDNHFQPMRGKAGPNVLAFFAMEQKSKVFCYLNANLTRADQLCQVIRFIEFWRKVMGKNPQWLYFDSKLTTYEELSHINTLGDVWFASSVNFFHLDCLSSEVRLNVDLDAVLTLLANGCYRWLASKLHGFDNSKPKSLYRKFVETSGTVEIAPSRRLLVHLDRRAHNSILREAQLDQGSPNIPWLANYKLEFIYS